MCPTNLGRDRTLLVQDVLRFCLHDQGGTNFERDVRNPIAIQIVGQVAIKACVGQEIEQKLGGGVGIACLWHLRHLRLMPFLEVWLGLGPNGF